MYKITILTIGVFIFLSTSCTKHEIIPAPTPKVDLLAHFEGVIGGQFIEYTENVDGYNGLSEIATQSSSGINNAQYFFSMQSPSSIPCIQIGLGSMIWNSASGTTVPDLTLFNSFFSSNDTPPYTDDAISGFEVTYHSLSGRDFESKGFSVNSQNVVYNGVVQESDATGDYSKFVCSFDCYIYNTVVDPVTLDETTDSLLVEQAIYTGWYQR